MKRHPDFNLWRDELESLGKDPDHLVRCAVQREHASHRIGVGSLSGLPVVEAQDGDPGAALDTLHIGEEAAMERNRAQHPEEAGSGCPGHERKRSVAQRNAPESQIEGGPLGESLTLVPIVRPHAEGRQDREDGDVRLALSSLAQEDDAFGLGIGQGLEESGLDQAEDHNVPGDSQRQG